MINWLIWEEIVKLVWIVKKLLNDNMTSDLVQRMKMHLLSIEKKISLKLSLTKNDQTEEKFDWLVLLLHGVDGVLDLGGPPVQHLLGGGQQKSCKRQQSSQAHRYDSLITTLGQSKILVPSTKAWGVGIPLKSVLHPPDDDVHSVRGRLDGGLQVEGWEGNVLHGEVCLQGIRDILVACNNFQ